MMSRTDTDAQALGPGMIVGGSVDCLLGMTPLLLPSPIVTLRNLYASERGEGRSADQVVHDVEQRWRRIVATERRVRRWSGIFDLAVGIPAFTTGLVFALARPGFAGMSSQTQYGWAGALVGFDFAIYEGVVNLAAPPAVDTALDTYELLKHGTTPGARPQVGFAPSRGGGTVVVGGTL